LLKRIDITSEGKIDNLPVNHGEVICADIPIRGFGKIEISVTLNMDNKENVSETAVGFVFGRFVLVWK